MTFIMNLFWSLTILSFFLFKLKKIPQKVNLTCDNLQTTPKIFFAENFRLELAKALAYKKRLKPMVSFSCYSSLIQLTQKKHCKND